MVRISVYRLIAMLCILWPVAHAMDRRYSNATRARAAVTAAKLKKTMISLTHFQDHAPDAAGNVTQAQDPKKTERTLSRKPLTNDVFSLYADAVSAPVVREPTSGKSLFHVLMAINGDKAHGHIATDVARLIMQYAAGWVDYARSGSYCIRDATKTESFYEDEAEFAKTHGYPEDPSYASYLRKNGHIVGVVDEQTRLVHLSTDKPYVPFHLNSEDINVAVSEDQRCVAANKVTPGSGMNSYIGVYHLDTAEIVPSLGVYAPCWDGNFTVTNNRVASFGNPTWLNVWDTTTNTKIINKSVEKYFNPKMCFLGDDLLLIAERGENKIALWDTRVDVEQGQERQCRTVDLQRGHFHIRSFEPSSDTGCVLIRITLEITSIMTTKVLEFGMKK